MTSRYDFCPNERALIRAAKLYELCPCWLHQALVFVAAYVFVNRKQERMFEQ